MYHNPNAYSVLPIGVVLRRTPGVTAWQKWSWTASSVLPGAGPAEWHELRRDGDTIEFHADTVPKPGVGVLIEGGAAGVFQHIL